jgi:hypothetical protein
MAGMLDAYSSPMGLLGGGPSGNPYDALDGITPEMFQAAFGIYPRAFPGRGLRGAPPDAFANGAPPAFMPQMSGFAGGQMPQAPQVMPAMAPPQAPPEAESAPTDTSAVRRNAFTVGAPPSFMPQLGGMPQNSMPTRPSMPAPSPGAAGIPAPQASGSPSFLDRLSNGLGANPNLLMAMGAGLASGGGIGGALKGAMMGTQLDQAQATEARQQQAIYSAMKARGYSETEARAAAFNKDMAKALVGREYEKRSLVEKDGSIISLDPSNPKQSGVVGAYPTFQKIQPGESGQFVTPGVPGGVGSATAAPSAQTVIPGMSLREKSSEQKLGEVEGENQAKLPGTIDQAQTALRLVDELQRNPVLPDVIGPIAGRIPAIGGPKADAINRIDQLKGQAFLSAFSSLRGGGQISNIEGEKATQAVTRLQRATSPEAFNTALNDLREVLHLGLKNAYLQAGQQPQAAQGQWQTIAPNVRIRQVP